MAQAQLIAILNFPKFSLNVSFPVSSFLHYAVPAKYPSRWLRHNLSYFQILQIFFPSISLPFSFFPLGCPSKVSKQVARDQPSVFDFFCKFSFSLSLYLSSFCPIGHPRKVPKQVAQGQPFVFPIFRNFISLYLSPFLLFVHRASQESTQAGGSGPTFRISHFSKFYISLSLSLSSFCP